MKKKVAVVELGDSHEECLESSLWFLSESNEVDLYINSVLLERTNHLRRYCRQVSAIDNKAGVVSITASLHLARTLRQQRYDAIFLNTAQGRIKFLCIFSLFNRTRFIGLLHNVNKLQKGFGQKLISRKIAQYLVLNDYLQISAQSLTKTPITSYYPIFFRLPRLNVEKPANQIWITVPGRVEYKRRDYQFLMDMAKRLTAYPEYKFIILGNMQATSDGRALAAQIKAEGLSDRFLTFTTFIPTPLFLSYIQASDIVLPLITPKVVDFHNYLAYKISGSWNMAFAFGKPMLVHPAFLQYADFHENALALEEFAEEDKLVEQLQACFNKDLYRQPKWQFSFQKERFIGHFKPLP